MEFSPFDQIYLQSAQNAAAARTYRLASRHGLSEAEREDIRQELILDLLERATKYDPSKATANTFTGMVSEHRAVEVLDGLMKERARRGFFQVVMRPTIPRCATRRTITATTWCRCGPKTETFSPTVWRYAIWKRRSST